MLIEKCVKLNEIEKTSMGGLAGQCPSSRGQGQTSSTSKLVDSWWGVKWGAKPPCVRDWKGAEGGAEHRSEAEPWKARPVAKRRGTPKQILFVSFEFTTMSGALNLEDYR